MTQQSIVPAQIGRIRNKDAEGLPLVYLHGAIGNHMAWLGLSRELAKGLPTHPGYLLDLPGHNADLPSCVSIEDYMASVLACLDAAGIEKAIFIGHSMGGGISQQMALDHPERVAALILLSTGAKLGVSEQIMNVFKDNFERALGLLSAFTFGQQISDELHEQIIEQMRQIGPETAIAAFTACHNFNVIDRISSVGCPAIVCCGDGDALTSPKKNKRLAQSLNCPYHQVPNTGHGLPIEKPGELAEIIRPFIESLDR